MNKRNLIKVLATVALTIGLAAPGLAASGTPIDTPPTLKGVTVVSAAEVKKLQDAGAAIIDTRVANEHSEKTIKGAISVWYHEKSPKAVDFDEKLDSFDLSKLPSDKAAPVVFFCNGADCWKSYKASVLALKAGYTKINWFRHGLPDWIKAGLPTK